MPSRTQVTLDPALDRRAKQRARELGISFSEYVRRVIADDLAGRQDGSVITHLAGIGDSGGSDVATMKDAYLDEAFEP
ncbi:MAG TPA: CopG family transcriptional regulator [Acidimicrobiia bacterium]|jgi:hypothetical protein